MRRELKRVPLDFDWPIGKIWAGFVNPHWKACPNPDCNHGSTPAAIVLEGAVSLILIAGEDARRGKKHPYLEWIGSHRFNGTLGPDATVLSTALAGRKPSFFGHDCIDRYNAKKTIIKAAGLPDDWGICPTCKGHAIDPECRAAYEAWEKAEPPSGPGWQLWETVSKGSPVSPVFATPAGLEDWMANNGFSRSGAREFLKSGWAPSFVARDGQLRSGVDDMANDEDRI